MAEVLIILLKKKNKVVKLYKNVKAIFGGC